jgi:hypothetical protein
MAKLCWHCNQPLARKPGGGYFVTIYQSPSGPVDVHKCCAESNAKTDPPHLWPSTEIRSDTYQEP